MKIYSPNITGSLIVTSSINTITGSLTVTTAFTASGLIYPSIDGTTGQVVTTDGAGNLSFLNIENTTISIKNVSGATIQKGTPCYITGSGTSGNLAGVWPADAANPLRMPAGVIAGETLIAGAEGVGLLNGFIANVNTSAFSAGNSIYVAVGGGYTNVRPTGSAVLIQKLGNVEKSHPTNGSGVINGPAYYNEVPNIQQGFTWVGNGNGVAIAVATSSIQNVVSASHASSTAAVAGTTNYVSKFTSGTTIGNSLIFDNGTNVGIGTTSPSTKLQVSEIGSNFFVGNAFAKVENTSGASSIFYLADTTDSAALKNIGSSLTFINSSTEGMRLTTTGLGIGTTSPSEKLDVSVVRSYGQSANIGIAVGGTDNGYVDNGTTSAWRQYVSGDSNGQALKFDGFLRGTGWTERMRITSGGNVGINTTTDAGFRLDVNGTARVSGNTQITGSLNVTQGITGSLLGTASYASQALSSSFATTASYVNTLNQAVTINGPLTVASTSSGAQSYNVLFSKNIAGATGAYNSTTTNTLAVTATTSSGFQSAALKNTLSIATNASYNYTFGHEWSAMTNELVVGSYGSVPFAADSIVNTVINTTNGYTRTIGTLYDMKFGYNNYGTVSTHYGIYHDASDARHYFAGNIGIGTTNPTAKLHIVAPGALSTDLGLRVRNSANTGDLLLVTGNGFVQTGVNGLAIPRADTPGGTNNAIISHQTNGLVRIDKSLEVSGVYGRSGFDTSQVALDLGYYSSTIRNYGSATNTGFTFNTIVATTGTYFMRMQNGATDVFNISSTGNVGIGKTTASTRLDVSGSVSISGSLGIGGNTRISSPFNTAASGSALSVYGSGSAQPVFTVQGSQGELFSVTDSLSGSLFSVNDISGLPIMEVFSDNTTLMGSYQDPMLITTTKLVTTASGAFTLYSLPTASYDTAFFEYSIRSGSNARAGSIMAMQLGSTVNFTETTTTDFGLTSGFGFTVQVAGANMILTGSATTSGWTIKTIVRGI
jgi:hypothetical protein